MSILFSAFNHAFKYPAPVTLRYSWSFGSALGFFFVLQVMSGLLVAFFFKPDAFLAFDSVVYIINDVYNGFILKYIHLNAVSFIFILMYAHILRGLFHYSFLNFPAMWISGMLLFVFSVITAFLGYVLPWGQMSFWAATVISNLVTVFPFVGEDILKFILGWFSVSSATLNRFFVLHFICAVFIVGLIYVHIIILHNLGSSNPTSISRGEYERGPFFYLFMVKDIFFFFCLLVIFFYVIFLLPNLLNHPDNFNPANPMVTPTHIVPEWYFLPFYAVLRSIPSKVYGFITMAAFLGVFFVLPLFIRFRAREHFWMAKLFSRYVFLKTISVVIILGYLGSAPAEEPFIGFAQFFVGFFFFIFFILWNIRGFSVFWMHTRNLIPKWDPYIGFHADLEPSGPVYVVGKPRQYFF